MHNERFRRLDVIKNGNLARKYLYFTYIYRYLVFCSDEELNGKNVNLR
jgi:hypothetical protein